MFHRLANGFVVDVVGADQADPPGDASQYGIYLRDRFGEIVSWTGDEWIEDPTVVASIVNAVMTGIVEPRVLRAMLNRSEQE